MTANAAGEPNIGRISYGKLEMVATTVGIVGVNS